jgi:hypothetical protein
LYWSENDVYAGASTAINGLNESMSFTVPYVNVTLSAVAEELCPKAAA